MSNNKLKVDIGYDDGLTTYTLIDSTANDSCCFFSEVVTIYIHDGNFKMGSEDKYHDKVKNFLEELVEDGFGWND